MNDLLTHKKYIARPIHEIGQNIICPYLGKYLDFGKILFQSCFYHSLTPNIMIRANLVTLTSKMFQNCTDLKDNVS